MSLIFDNLKSLERQEQEPDWEAVSGRTEPVDRSAGSWASRASVLLAVLAVGVAGGWLFWPDRSADTPAMAQSETGSMTPVVDEPEPTQPAGSSPGEPDPVGIAQGGQPAASDNDDAGDEPVVTDPEPLQSPPDNLIAAAPEADEDTDSSSPLSDADTRTSDDDEVIDVVETVGNDSGTGSVTMTVRPASGDDVDSDDSGSSAGQIEITRAEEEPATQNENTSAIESAVERESTGNEVTTPTQSRPQQVASSSEPSGTVGTDPLPSARRSDVPERQQVETMRSRLLLALEAGQNEQARQVLEQLDQQMGNDSAFVRRMRAYYLLNTGQFDEAEDAYDRVLIDNPQDAEARLNSGWLAWQREDLVKARNRLRPLLTDDRFGDQASTYMNAIERQAREGL
ncbi:MAG: tetratricopeptide repeat protein [Pseudomonadota bacterium]